MIVSRALIAVFISHIYALKSLFDPPICHLNTELRGLNTQNLKPTTILHTASLPGFCSPSEQSRYDQPEKFIRLAYVTPWNSHGYDLAKWFASTFTHISPVWYQLVLNDDHDRTRPSLAGGHDVDAGWLRELRTAYRPPKIVPRIQLQFTQKAAEAILYYPRGQAEQIAEVLVSEVEKYGYDGVALEVPAPHVFLSLIARIGDALHDIGKELVLVIPPQHVPEQAGTVFNAEHVTELENEVDHFAVMTYDHAGALGREGPNSPLPWMREVVHSLVQSGDDDFEEYPDLADLADDSGSVNTMSSKILMGLPFYGYRFSRGGAPEAYTASNYLDLLKQSGVQISWDETSKEHRLASSGSFLWYPSILSLLHRLQLAEEMGVGVAIWELGQGLDQFVDIL